MGKNRRKKTGEEDGAQHPPTDQEQTPAMSGVVQTPQGGTEKGRGRGRGRGRVSSIDDYPPLGGTPLPAPQVAKAQEEFPSLGASAPPNQRPGQGAGRGRGSRNPQAPSATPALSQTPPTQPPVAQAPHGQPPVGQAPHGQPPVGQAPAAVPTEQMSRLDINPQPRLHQQPQGKVQLITREELAIQQYQAQELRPPKRPGYGTRGRPLEMKTNHFMIKVDYRRLIQHYDVQFVELDAPARPRAPGGKVRPMPKGLTRALVQLVEDENPQIFNGNPVVYDGVANIWVAKALQLRDNGNEETFDVCRKHPDKGTKQKFRVTLKWAAAIRLDNLERYMRGDLDDIPQNEVNAIDAVLRQIQSMRTDMTAVGRSFFVKPNNPEAAYLGGGREIWFGYYQSARISNSKCMTLNINVTASSFYPEQNLASFAGEFLNIRDHDMRPLRENIVLKLRREVTGLKVFYSYAGRKTRKITSISMRPASAQTFSLGDNKRPMTVANYFKDKYKINLRYGHLPCVQFGRKDGQTFVPMELCTLMGGQRGQRKMTEQQTSSMIKKTAMPPAQRLQEIQRNVRESNFGQDKYAQSFGISVDSNVMSVGGRILEAPPMLYNGEKRAQPRQGAWETRNLRFHTANKPVPNWAMFSFCDRTDDNRLNQFVNQLMDACRANGMDIKYPNVCQGRVKHDDCRHTLTQVAHAGYTFVICILPTMGGSDLYALVKQVANVELGIISQCLKAGTLQKANPMLLGNVCQKINAKLGGINGIPQDNYVFSRIMNRPTIIMGADVTHPSPGDKFRPSIAAVVASMDRWAVRYSMEVRVQTHRQEMIADMTEMVKSLIMKFYHSTNRQKPEKILFYRDGVSEGQFSQVLNIELRAIQAACLAISPEYNPAITLSIVQKRHHTRFLPSNPNDGEGKNRNVPAGTCVDKGVTHPTEFDYYLCSHAGIQGTSRPAHYQALFDDSEFSADDLEAMSFYLCHCYSNCTRSVSIPAPAYYAHKGAFMARHHLETIYDNGSVHSGSSCDSNGDPTDAMRKAIEVSDKVKDKMYFL